MTPEEYKAGWELLPLTNGFIAFDNNYPPLYRVEGNAIKLKGCIKTVDDTHGGVVAILPVNTISMPIPQPFVVKVINGDRESSQFSFRGKELVCWDAVSNKNNRKVELSPIWGLIS